MVQGSKNFFHVSGQTTNRKTIKNLKKFIVIRKINDSVVCTYRNVSIKLSFNRFNIGGIPTRHLSYMPDIINRETGSNQFGKA